jgi:hypothetical protein
MIKNKLKKEIGVLFKKNWSKLFSKILSILKNAIYISFLLNLYFKK